MGHIRRLLLTIFVLFSLLILYGCGPKPTLAEYMKPELLYLQEAPYRSLYVEVDVVEGSEVSDEWLDVLKEFLETHCSMPDGIKIVCDEPVPLDEIRDLQIGPASIVCIDGPDPLLSSQPAYLHVFFYNWKKTFKKAELASHIISNCPNTIFFPTDKWFQKNIAPCALQHEAGHVLGLCKDTSHGDGAHCKNNNCLMNPSPGLLSDIELIFGVQVEKSLCNDCLNDLEKYKSESTEPNLTFDGPFLVRKEKGYLVANLPYCAYIIPESFENKFDWHDLLAVIKQQCREQKNRYFLNGILIAKRLDDSPADMSLYRDIFAKAANDPDPMVRQYAIQELKKLENKQQ